MFFQAKPQRISDANFVFCKVLLQPGHLMYPVATYFYFVHNQVLVLQPLLPALTHFFFGQIGFCQFDKESVMAGFALHKAAVKIAHVGIVKAFASRLKRSQLRASINAIVSR